MTAALGCYIGIVLFRSRGVFADAPEASCPATSPRGIYLFAQGLRIVVIRVIRMIVAKVGLPSSDNAL